jgi:hypothetical protein
MSTSTETNPFLNFKLANPDDENTSTQALVPTRPTTPILDQSVVLDLTPDHGTAPTYSLVETPPNREPLFNIIALHSLPNMMKLWNRLLQRGLQEDNGGFEQATIQLSKPSAHFTCDFPLVLASGSLLSLVPSEGFSLQMKPSLGQDLRFASRTALSQHSSLPENIPLILFA